MIKVAGEVEVMTSATCVSSVNSVFSVANRVLQA